MNSDKYQEACDDVKKENHEGENWGDVASPQGGNRNDVENQEGENWGDMENPQGGYRDDVENPEGENWGDMEDPQGGYLDDVENPEGENWGDMEDPQGGDRDDVENHEGEDWGDEENLEDGDWGDEEDPEGGNWDEGGDWDAAMEDNVEEEHYGGRHRYLSFEQTYGCYSMSFVQKSHLAEGDKVIMPESALQRLAYLRIDYPMTFEIIKQSSDRISHCGVLEFTADEGQIYLPDWMMENMQLEEGDVVIIKNVSLLDGTYMKMQPHSKDFLDIKNPKAILEKTLRNYTCLTMGDAIMIRYNDKKFYINILETKPSPAILIVDTDCEVDFAPPLDYKETEKPPVSSSTNSDTDKVNSSKFSSFTGSARRLDGKSTVPSNSSSSSVLNQLRPEEETGQTNGSNQRYPGKIIFGSNVKAKSFSKEIKKEEPSSKKKAEEEEEEELKFKAFSGKKYSLKD